MSDPGTSGGTGTVGGLRRMAVGLDGSIHAQRGLEWAAAVAAQTGAEVVAVHALGLLVDTEDGPMPSASQKERLEGKLSGEWTALLRDAGVKHRCILAEGSPVSGLLHVAAEEDADLIVVGSRGSGGFSELHLGSTSHQVVLYSDRPVLVVPPLGRVRPGISPGS
ncbi:MAG TPA: universal stress protein [Acidimicrobiia bacterium]|nr:universal stress protein [Acidimicrobiia bacterium]